VDAIRELAGQLIEHLAPGAGDRDGGALLVERARDRAADPASCTSHERGLAGQIEHGSNPW
jgi:hypothetical protein